MKTEISGTTAHVEAASASPSPAAVSAAIDDIIYRPDLVRLKSAYSSLTPDCDDRVKAFYRIAPAAREARLHPDIADELYKLLRAWASGELHGIEAKGWSTIGSNGLTGQQMFEALWARFVTQTGYSGKETTLGSVYHHARQAGWPYESTDFNE